MEYNDSQVSGLITHACFGRQRWLRQYARFRRDVALVGSSLRQ